MEAPLDFSIRHYLFPKINPEAWKFVCAALLLAIVIGWFAPWTGFLLWMLPVAVCYFFRDPERVPPKDAAAIVSPADGTVCLLREIPRPKELESGAEKVWCVSIFMSVLNVHVNRAPASGTIEKIHYIHGRYLNASLDKASEFNEREHYLLKTADGQLLAFTQIAGLVARRIVSYLKAGQNIERGERFGLIRFGSRLDVYLPPGVQPEVSLGQTMVAGESRLARLAVHH